jgi:hypothetical protein
VKIVWTENDVKMGQVVGRVADAGRERWIIGYQPKPTKPRDGDSNTYVMTSLMDGLVNHYETKQELVDALNSNAMWPNELLDAYFDHTAKWANEPMKGSSTITIER